jgi:hypothetical protein
MGPLAAAQGPHRSASKVGPALVLVFALLAGTLMALIIGIGAGVYAIVFAGALTGLFLLARPQLMFPLLLVLIFLLDGLAQTLLGLGQLQWVISGLGLALLAGSWLGLSRPAAPPFAGRRPITPIIVCTAVFFLVIIASTAINGASFGQLVVGLRSYVAMWGVFVFIAAGYEDPRTMRRLFWVLLAFAAIQWPFAVYQHFFVVTQREALHIAGSSWDSVVGSFGGNKFGGGQSSSLGIFLAVMIVVASSLLWHGRMKGPMYMLLLVSALVGIGLAETKIVFVLIPAGLAILFRRDLLTRPLLFIGGTLSMVALLSGVLFAYHSLYWAGRTRLNTVDDIVERFTYSFKPDYYAGGFWPGRVTALKIWGQKNHVGAEPVSTLIGNGAAAAVSFSSLIGQGDLTQRFGVGLEASGASKLLWEGGIMGLLAFLSLSAAGYVCAGRALQRGVEDPGDRAILCAMQAAMPLYAAVVFYETTIVSVPAMQFMFMLSLGYVQYWYLRTLPSRR